MVQQLGPERAKPTTKILIITEFFPGVDRGMGPWSERFDGLYLQGLKGKLDLANDALWYSVSEAVLIESLGSDLIKKVMNFYLFCLREIFISMFSKSKRIYLIGYPCFRTREIVNGKAIGDQ